MATYDYSTINYGQCWKNGRLVKPFFHVPAMNTYLFNIKRLIILNQDVALASVSENEGIPYAPIGGKPNEALIPFNEKQIHFGLWKDQNAHALYMQCTMSSLFGSNSRRDDIEMKLTCTTGAQQDLDKAYRFATCYLRAIQMILECCDPQELVFGWANGKLPKIILNGEHNESPTVLSLSADLGGVPELTINFISLAQRNI